MTPPKKTGYAVLTGEQEADLCAAWIAGESQTSLAERFGVGRNTVQRVLKRRGITAGMRTAEPPTVGGRRKKVQPRPEFRKDYKRLGKVPVDDSLEIVAWTQRAVAIGLQHVLTDEEYQGSEEERRKELRELARAIVQTTPQTLIHDALKAIREDAEQLEEGSGPEMRRAPDKRKRPRRAKTS